MSLFSNFIYLIHTKHFPYNISFKIINRKISPPMGFDPQPCICLVVSIGRTRIVLKLPRDGLLAFDAKISWEKSGEVL